jgi:hypothetical protein
MEARSLLVYLSVCILQGAPGLQAVVCLVVGRGSTEWLMMVVVLNNGPKGYVSKSYRNFQY